ncbi:MAG: Ig domain-containing protein, partial [Mycoplasmataceae bacterium]|nr:Ig domain-containing protein [Mycoplasmataceae bacterium]
MKNKTELSKFCKNNKPLNSQNDVLANEQQRISKHRNKIKTSLIASTLGVSIVNVIGGGALTGCSDVSSTLTINNATNITGNVNRSIKKTTALVCRTSAGAIITDVTYSAFNLPAGLVINAFTGVISGTPTESKSGNYTIVITSNEHPAASSQITKHFEISPAIPNSLNIYNAVDIFGNQNTAIEAGGSTPALACITDAGVPVTNVTYSSSDNLPTGLNFDSSTGSISGTPTAKGTGIYNITAEAIVDGKTLWGDIERSFSIGEPFPTSLVITGATNIT